MLTLLNKSYPSYKDTAELLKFALGVSIFLFFFFIVFQPFAMHELSFQRLLFISGSYSVLTFCTIWVYILFMKLFFPKFLFKSDWKVKDEIMHIFILFDFVIIAIIFINTILGDLDISFQNIFFQLLKVLSIAIIPTFIVSVIKYQIHLYKILDENERLLLSGNKALAKASGNKIDNPHLIPDTNDSIILEIGSKNKSDPLCMKCNQFLFAKSDGNYVDLFYLIDTKVVTETIRTPLKELMGQLEFCLKFIQCHRTYIINIEHVEEIKGNSRSALAKLKFSKQEIPISRSYFQKCKASFEAHLAKT